MAFQHVIVPVAQVMHLIVNADKALINNDDTKILAIIDDDLHIIIGDFKGIDDAEDLSEILKRNL